MLDSLKTGAVLSALAWPLGGPTIGLSYSLGSLFGSAYLYLLGKRVDTIGSGVSTSQASRGISKRDELLANSRFLAPLLLVLTLSAKNLLLDPDHVDLRAMHLLGREEFLAAVAGLLTNRLSLFYTEVFSQMTQTDWLSFLPGSFAEAFRQKELLQGSNTASSKLLAATAQQQNDLITVVCVSGPTAGGREAVAERLGALYAGSLDSRKKKEFPRSKLDLRSCVLVTPDAALAQSRPDKYRLVSPGEFASAESRALYSGSYKRLFGPDSPVALLAEDLPTLAGGRGAVPVYLVEGPSDLIEALSKQENVRLLSVWVSLQTKEQFVAKAKDMIQTQVMVYLVTFFLHITIIYSVSYPIYIYSRRPTDFRL